MNAGSLYEIRLCQVDETGLEARIHFQETHPLYEGHFPGFPLTPGVCQMALVRDSLELALGRALRLKKARHLKFMHMHQASSEPSLLLNVRIREDQGVLHSDATLAGKEKTLFKMKAHFV